jgi:hypothetical protein
MYQGRKWSNRKEDGVTGNGADVTGREWCNRKIAVVTGMWWCNREVSGVPGEGAGVSGM